MGEFCLLVELHREGSARSHEAGLFLPEQERSGGDEGGNAGPL